jgi:hypothetical protein
VSSAGQQDSSIAAINAKTGAPLWTNQDLAVAEFAGHTGQTANPRTASRVQARKVTASSSAARTAARRRFAATWTDRPESGKLVWRGSKP